MSELETVLELLSHERIEVRKRAVDILAVICNGQGTQANAVVAHVGSMDHLPKILALISPANHLLHGTLYMTLINMVANAEHGTEVARRLCDLRAVQQIMRMLTTPSALPPENIQNMQLMLLTNITSVGGSAAVNAVLQYEASDDTRGYYLDALMTRMTEHECPAITGKWILNILTNVTSEALAQDAVMNHDEAIEIMKKCLFHCDPLTNTYYAMCVLRNLCMNKSHHKALINAEIPHQVLENFQKDRPANYPDMCNAYVEFIYALCTSEEGIQFMDSVNGKRILEEATAKESHTILQADCKDSFKRIRERLLNILDDVQDVVLAENSENPE
eukprot:PhF_6_TR43562/c0_g1_i1/m.66896